MRLGVLDVGSNTVHMLVVDAHPGAAPLPAAKVRTELRLLELFDADDHLSADGIERLVHAITEARETADELGVEDLAAFATSALRGASNVDRVLDRVRAEAQVDLEILDGEDEARLTFLAARRWFGWSAGLLLMVDIGGGSLELAIGRDEEPHAVASLPLGAGRLTQAWQPHDPPTPSDLTRLREEVRAELADAVGPFVGYDGAGLTVGTSKTLRSLARIAGAAPYSAGPHVRRVLTRKQATTVADRLADMSAKKRSSLPGVSVGRAEQMVAGAVVAEAALDLLEVDELVICPWALREGVILQRLDWLTAN